MAFKFGEIWSTRRSPKVQAFTHVIVHAGKSLKDWQQAIIVTPNKNVIAIMKRVIVADATSLPDSLTVWVTEILIAVGSYTRHIPLEKVK